MKPLIKEESSVEEIEMPIMEPQMMIRSKTAVVKQKESMSSIQMQSEQHPKSADHDVKEPQF